jgi:phosphoglycerate dehydrogenase-like enzyme
MVKPLFLIPHDFEDRRFFVGWDKIPYDFSGAKLRDEICERTSELDVRLSNLEKETTEILQQADFMAADKLSRQRFDTGVKLRWVHISSSGADHFFKRSQITADELRQRNIMVTTSKGAGVVVIAEQVLCYMLMFSRNMVRAVRQHLVGHWERYHGQELCGMTLGVIGLGAIGSRVAYLAKALGMKTIGCKRDITTVIPWVDRIYPAEDYREVMQLSDYILLCVPISPATDRIINDESLSWMKPSAYLMNVARGECVDEDALVRALQRGIIAGYAGDNHGRPDGPVTDENMERLAPGSKLWGMPNVIVTPNCAVAGPRRYEYMAEIIVANFDAISKGAQPKTRLIWEGKPV